MAFQEKIEWLALVLMAVAFGIYFSLVGMAIVTAEIVRRIVMLISYRKGWNG